MKKSTAALVGAGMLLHSAQVGAADCRMSLGFQHSLDGERSSSAPVWKATASEGTTVLFRRHLNINTDGTRRSYSVEDFWGETRAINNLCNAMSDACRGLTSDQKRNRRIATQEAMAAGWPADKVGKTKIDSSIIAFRNGRPCPEVDGFLISMTSLRAAGGQDACDQKNYLDALAVPAIVLPRGSTGFDAAGAKIGDLVVAMAPKTGTPVYGVVGDAGPARKLGEASVAMNGALNGISREPKNYQDVKAQWGVADATVLIFAGSKDTRSPYVTADRIEKDASDRFKAWGGGSVEGAKARLAACSAAIGK